MVFQLLLIFAAMTEPAFAYVDPNAGGLIAQIVTPLLLILAVTWNRIRRLVVVAARRVWHFLLEKTN
jgi:hypothetical protein